MLSLCGALWTAAATPLVAQPAYRVVQVAPADATHSSDAFVDPTGTYVAGIATTGIQVRPFLWTAGTSVYLATDAARLIFDSNVVVNASGQVAGSASTATDGSQAAFRWTASSETRLQSLYTTNFQGRLNTAALAINAAGDVVGRSDINPSAVRAVRWPGGSASLTRVDNDRHAVARSINDAGVVVGSVLVYPCPTRADVQCWRAARWNNGAITIFEPAPGYMNSSAYDINEAGDIVGMAYNGNTQFAAMRWSHGVGTVLPSLNARNIMAANSINASGRIVGRYLASQYRGFLWQDGTTYDLTGLLDASGAGWEVRDATSISDDGKIAVEVCRSTDGRCAAALLVPVAPSPPVGEHTRYLAEGATGAFFDTRIALLNPGSQYASATLRYLPSSGVPIEQGVTVPARSRLTIDPKLVPGLGGAEFSTVVQSSHELVVDRTMSWGPSGYGSHSETAVRSPSTTWYLAEGATIGGFDLFYLLQNPAPTPTTVRVRYLRTTGAPLVKSYTLPPLSRTNIWVNVEDFPGVGKALSSAEFSAVLESEDGTPFIVERAMYLSSQGRLFNAGHESTGVTAPATEWFLAEGATGSFFDMFVLIANPNPTDAAVTVSYALTDGTTYTRDFVAPANARSQIWVDYEQFPGVPGFPLLDAALSTSVRSTNGVPLVVERAMWWPGDSRTWHEAHNSAGATTTGTRWAVAEGEVGGTRGYDTYLLIANTSASAGSARVTLLFEDGSSEMRTYALPASSRTNVEVRTDFGPGVTGRRFGALIESLGTTPAQIVVERAMYSSEGGVTFAAGTNALATKLQ